VQVDAGVSAVQLFDSWVGALPRRTTARTSSRTAPGCWPPVADVPRIHFGVGTGELLHDMGSEDLRDLPGPGERPPRPRPRDARGHHVTLADVATVERPPAWTGGKMMARR
jgi:uroporphyrinogen-III decarboxylase